VYKLLGFSRLKKLYDTRVRILVALYCNVFILADSSLNSFKYIVGVIDTLKNIRITLDKEILGEGDFSKFCK